MNRIAAVLLGLLVVPAASAYADGDAAKGLNVFKRCMACHDATKPVNKTGPHLVGIIGRATASVEGYSYSTGMTEFAKTAGNWDEAKLDAYLTDPRKMVPGTRMALAPMKTAEDRANVIAYLKSLAAP